MIVEELPDLGITRISRWIFNCYVIHDGGSGRPVVVDAGLPTLAERALRLVADRGLGDVASVVATHAHSDHVAGAATISSATGASVHLPERAMAYLGGETPRTPGPREIAKFWPVYLDQPRDFGALRELNEVGPVAGYGRGPMVMPLMPGAPLLDGTALPGAPDWEVSVTSGHTDDSIVFRRASTNTMLSGDTVLSADARPWFNPEFVDAVASADTEARLREIEVDHLLPGHGRPVLGSDVLRSARSHREVGRGDARGSARRWARWLADR